MDNNKIHLSENIINDLNKFEIIYNIKIFKKNTLRNNMKIINDCNRIKKKKLHELINELKIVYNNMIDTMKIKSLQQKTLEDIDNLNSIINIVTNYNMDFIEIYSN